MVNFKFQFLTCLDNIPGRFRYDKESDEEEDDEDEFTLRSHKNSEEYDDSISSKYNYYNPQATATENNKSPEVCNYHFNYQTYRAECSKLMADDAYDPNSIHDRHEPEGFDLRNFLREKAYKHQQESGVRLAEGSTLSTKTNENGDVVYEQPITQPIDIKNELSKLKRKNYFDYFNNNNRRKNYRMSGRDSHNDYFDHRNSYSNERCQYFNNNNNNNKLNRSNSRNEEKHTEDQEPASSDEDESSDEDSASNCKKLRSVVAVISNKFVSCLSINLIICLIYLNF